MSFLRKILKLIDLILCFIVVYTIRVYRTFLSPFFGFECRFEPTCSVYGIQSFKRFGFLYGIILLSWRLLRCHPWCQGGKDPVPDNIDTYGTIKRMNVNIKNILKKIFSYKNIPVLIFFVLFNFVFVLQYITYDPMVSAFRPNPSWLLWSVIYSVTIFLIVRYTHALWVRIFMFCVVCTSIILTFTFMAFQYITGSGFSHLDQYMTLKAIYVFPASLQWVPLVAVIIAITCASMVLFFQKKHIGKKVIVLLVLSFIVCLAVFEPLKNLRTYAINQYSYTKRLRATKGELYAKYQTARTHMQQNFAPTLPKNIHKRNVVWIYMESLEQGYFDKGVMTHLENLRNHSLVLNNIVEAIIRLSIKGEFASQCAVPHRFLLKTMSLITISKIKCTMDVLRNHGWYSVFMITSNRDFANTYSILKQHFNKIYGYKSYIDNKKINKLTPKDIANQFGINDQGLVKVAKLEYVKLMNRHQPFDLVLATIDNHLGNIVSSDCDFLKKTVKDPFYLQAACTDYNVWKLIQFMIKKSPNNNPPVFVIMSDHINPNNMQAKKRFGNKRRLTFFIYDPAHPKHKVYHGMATHFDIPPTVLDYLGLKINHMYLGQSMLKNKEGFAPKLFHNNVKDMLELFVYSTLYD